MDLLFSNLHIILDILLRYMVNLLLFVFTGPANLLGGFVFMASSLSFFFFTISKERRGAGEGAFQWRFIHFICGNYWHTWLGWYFSGESMSFVWQSILSRRLFLFLPIDCIDFSLPLEPLFLILESNLSSKAIKFCKLWKIWATSKVGELSSCWTHFYLCIREARLFMSTRIFICFLIMPMFYLFIFFYETYALNNSSIVAYLIWQNIVVHFYIFKEKG